VRSIERDEHSGASQRCLALLQRMHKERPLYRALPSNLDVVLTKTTRGSRITINGLSAGSWNTG
jgi:phosphoenolpyruvate carboxylase